MRTVLGFLVLLAGVPSVVAAPLDPAELKGKWELWEDSEGGTVCPVALSDEATIGGFALEGDEACLRSLKLPGDPYAWFINQARQLVLVDPTRKALLRLDALEDGSFYAQRGDAGLENLNLTPVK